MQEAKEIGDEFLALEKYVNLNYLVRTVSMCHLIIPSKASNTSQADEFLSSTEKNLAEVVSETMSSAKLVGSAAAGLSQNPEEARQGAAACTLPTVLCGPPPSPALGAGSRLSPGSLVPASNMMCTKHWPSLDSLIHVPRTSDLALACTVLV